MLAEAGTGVGKTLGYIAPASLWAEKNQGTVWLSTYTRNLQSQIDGELDRLYPDPAQKRRRVVIRKGRENFLCLLNYEDAARAASARTGPSAAALVLIARWTSATASGDLAAGDFPGWLAELIGRSRINSLADRRGECIHSACPHFRRCFIEKNVRAARHARLVVANHALVMAQAALGGLDDAALPTRYVFDEGHHLLDAADAAFSVRLSGHEGRELRRWLLGAEAGRSRARGLRRRIGDLVEADEEAEAALVEALVASRILPADFWHQRLADDKPLPGFEAFLALVRHQVLARAASGDTAYRIEAEARPPIEGLIESATRLAGGLDRLSAALRRLAAWLRRRLEDPDNPPDTAVRQRLDAVVRGLERRAIVQLGGWSALLRDLGEPARPETVEWLAIERFEGAETDIAINRNWIDPGIPFAAGGRKTGARSRRHLGDADRRRSRAGPRLAGGRGRDRAAPSAGEPGSARASPRRSTTRRRPACLIVTDIPRDDIGQVAAAFAALMRASRGRRARAVHGDRAAARGARADRAGPRSRRAAIAGAACRCDVDRDARRHLSRRGGFLPARHRCGARRGRRAGPLAAAHRFRPGAMAAPRHPAPRAQAGVWRRAI